MGQKMMYVLNNQDSDVESLLGPPQIRMNRLFPVHLIK